MNVKRLRDAIGSIADVVEAAGTKKAGSDIRALEELLTGDEARSASEALAELGDVLAEEDLQRRRTYIELLAQAGLEESLFDKVLGDLAKDRAVTKLDADAIAHGYIDGRKKWKSKKAAIEAIKTRFIERSYQASKLKIVEKSKVW